MDLFEGRSAQPMLIAQQREAFDDPEWIYKLKWSNGHIFVQTDLTKRK